MTLAEETQSSTESLASLQTLRSVMEFNECNEAENSALPLESRAAPHLPGPCEAAVQAVLPSPRHGQFPAGRRTPGCLEVFSGYQLTEITPT